MECQLQLQLAVKSRVASQLVKLCSQEVRALTKVVIAPCSQTSIQIASWQSQACRWATKLIKRLLQKLEYHVLVEQTASALQLETLADDLTSFSLLFQVPMKVAVLVLSQ